MRQKDLDKYSFCQKFYKKRRAQLSEWTASPSILFLNNDSQKINVKKSVCWLRTCKWWAKLDGCKTRLLIMRTRGRENCEGKPKLEKNAWIACDKGVFRLMGGPNFCVSRCKFGANTWIFCGFLSLHQGDSLFCSPLCASWVAKFGKKRECRWFPPIHG